MFIFALCSGFLGAALGIRYRVFVLLPTIVLGSAALIGIACVEGTSPARTVVCIVVLSVATQAGYLLANLARLREPTGELRDRAAQTA